MIHQHYKLKIRKCNLEKVESIILSAKQAGQPIDIATLAKMTGLSRQTFYSEEYQNLLEKYEVGKKFKKALTVPADHLLARVDEKDNEIQELNKKIDKLRLKIADIEKENLEHIEENERLRRRFNDFRASYYDLIVDYNRIINRPLSIEPFDLEKETHKDIAGKSSLIQNPSVIHIKKKE